MKQKLTTIFDNITAFIYAAYIALASSALVMSSAVPFNLPRPWPVRYEYEVRDVLEDRGVKFWWRKGKLKTRFK